MHCGSCSKRFSLMRTKKQCSECRRSYCKYCVTRKTNRDINCENCAILTARPLNRTAILKIKAKELQLYLANQQVNTKGCIEKEDLINLLLAHANGPEIQQSRPQSIQDDSSPGRHLLRNIRQFFTSSPDISGTRNPEGSGVNNLSTHSTPNTTQRVCYQPVPPYFNSNNANRLIDNLDSAEEITEVDNLRVASSTEALISEQSSLPSMPRSMPSTGDFIPTPELSSSESDVRTNPRWPTSPEELVQLDKEIKDEPLALEDIKSVKELEDLSIQQLKGLLMRNRVDFKGCVEKLELLDRVKRLWMEYLETREGIENFAMDDLCKICMDAPIECVMLECGHMATCTSCGKQLSECPICRQYVVRVVRTFKA